MTLDRYYSYDHQYTMTINKVQHSTVILDLFQLHVCCIIITFVNSNIVLHALLKCIGIMDYVICQSSYFNNPHTHQTLDLLGTICFFHHLTVALMEMDLISCLICSRSNAKCCMLTNQTSKGRAFEFPVMFW